LSKHKNFTAWVIAKLVEQNHEHTLLSIFTIPFSKSRRAIALFCKLNDTQKTPDKVPSTVHNLLTSTKRLQEVLRLWSVEQASEGDVSDTYVQIGNEFNLTISAFAEHQIDLRYAPTFLGS
jgi:hypothetical protein